MKNYPEFLNAAYANYFDALNEGDEAMNIEQFAECMGVEPLDAAPEMEEPLPEEPDEPEADPDLDDKALWEEMRGDEEFREWAAQLFNGDVVKVGRGDNEKIYVDGNEAYLEIYRQWKQAKEWKGLERDYKEHAEFWENKFNEAMQQLEEMQGIVKEVRDIANKAVSENGELIAKVNELEAKNERYADKCEALEDENKELRAKVDNYRNAAAAMARMIRG